MPASMVDVRTILAGTFDDVDRVATSPAVTRALLDDLRNAEKVLAAKLRKEAQKFGSLDSRFTGSAALAYQQQVQQSIEYVQHRLRGHTKEAARAACEQGVSQAATLLEGLERRFGGVTIPIRLRQSAQLRHDVATNAGGLWARQFPTSVDRYGAHMMGQFEETIRAGMLAGSTMDEMIAAFTGHGGPTGAVSMSAKITPTGVLRVVEEDIPEGLFVRHKYWAERIVRTEVIRAYNGAKHAGMVEMGAQFPDMQRKILAILDKRTAADSIAVHGQIRDMKTPFTDGAGRVYMFPPARPNDRETVIPWRPHWNDSADNMSVWEKACCGELDDPAVEAKLAKAMEQIAKGSGTGKAPGKPRGPRKPKPPPTPMAMPSPPTPEQLREADFRSRVAVNTLGPNVRTVDVDGVNIGWTERNPATGKLRALLKPTARGAGGGPAAPLSGVEHDKVEDAVRELQAHANGIFARGAAQFEPWKEKAWQDACAATDVPRARRLVRSLLDTHGVLARDALHAADAINQSYTKTDAQMPDALAVHHWDGRVGIRHGAFKRSGNEAILAMVHEELHGATKFAGPGFYAGHGAAVEEATVEMAARKIASAATYEKPLWHYGAYQPTINHITNIIADETGGRGATNDQRRALERTAFERIADAGIKMRSKSSTVAPYSTADDITDAFVDALDVSAAAKVQIRHRIKAEVKSPR